MQSSEKQQQSESNLKDNEQNDNLKKDYVSLQNHIFNKDNKLAETNKINIILSKKEMKKKTKEDNKKNRDRRDKIAIFLATWFFLLSLDRLYLHRWSEALIKFVFHYTMLPTLGYIIYAVFSGLVQHQNLGSLFGTWDYIIMGICIVGSIFVISWDVYDNLNLRKYGAPIF